MEAQFALRTLQRPTIVVEVGNHENNWRETAVGMLTEDLPLVSFTDVQSESDFKVKLLMLLNSVADNLDGESNFKKILNDVVKSQTVNNDIAAVGDNFKSKSLSLRSTGMVGGGLFKIKKKKKKLKKAISINASDEISFKEKNSVPAMAQLAVSPAPRNQPQSSLRYDGDDQDMLSMDILSAPAQHQAPVQPNLFNLENSMDEEEDASQKPFFSISPRRTPQPGDKIIAHYLNWSFYEANVVSFDTSSLQFEVEWPDGDTTGTKQSFEYIALDIPPNEATIGIGTEVVFKQGKNTNGLDVWNLGTVTKVTRSDTGYVFDGKHVKTSYDGKVEHTGYNTTFTGYHVDNLRVLLNPIDLIGQM